MTERVPGPEAALGPVIGAGRASTVHDLGDGTVLRRSRFPGADMRGEAAVMRHAAEHGVRVPRVLHADGPDLVMERIEGPTLTEAFFADPHRIPERARLLADVHRQLDDVPAPPWLADQLPAAERRGARLLHLDVNPLNVMLGPDGTVLIDWTNAAAGERAEDVAVTWVVLACFGYDDDVPADVAPFVAEARRSIVETFLTAVDVASATRALPRAAERRRRDVGTTDAERIRIDALLRDAVG